MPLKNVLQELNEEFDELPSVEDTEENTMSNTNMFGNETGGLGYSNMIDKWMKKMS